MPRLSPRTMLALFVTVNFFNYIDRGLIPGAPNQFQLFIVNSLKIDVTEESKYLGLLSSLFIAAYAAAALIFGHVSSMFPPLKMIGFGMTIWVVAIIICGLSKDLESFAMLAFGRALSGVGEASFQCVAPPLITDAAPPESRVFWLALHFTAIPFGQAVGFEYGAVMADTVGWDWAYWIEAIPMVLLVIICYVMEPPRNTMTKAEQPLLSSSGDTGNPRQEIGVSAPGGEALVQPPSLVEELKTVMSSPIFVMCTIGYSAYVATVAGFSTFGPTFLIGLGMFTSQSSASLTFGSVVAFVGVLGTPFGGWLVDFATRNLTGNHSKQRMALMQMVVFMIIAFVSIFMCSFQTERLPFMTLLGAGCFCLFATSASVNLCIMESVPDIMRPFAIALHTLLIHLFGDVPSPILIGYFKDVYAPLCGTVEDESGSTYISIRFFYQTCF